MVVDDCTLEACVVLRLDALVLIWICGAVVENGFVTLPYLTLPYLTLPYLTLPYHTLA